MNINSYIFNINKMLENFLFIQSLYYMKKEKEDRYVREYWAYYDSCVFRGRCGCHHYKFTKEKEVIWCLHEDHLLKNVWESESFDMKKHHCDRMEATSMVSLCFCFFIAYSLLLWLSVPLPFRCFVVPMKNRAIPIIQVCLFRVIAKPIIINSVDIYSSYISFG